MQPVQEDIASAGLMCNSVPVASDATDTETQDVVAAGGAVWRKPVLMSTALAAAGIFLGLAVASGKTALPVGAAPPVVQLMWSSTPVPGVPCSNNTESCLESKCCSQPDMQCYIKNEHWASCNATCQPGLMDDKTDTKKSAWRCIELGERSPPPPPKNESVPCSNNTESCLESKCCSQPDMQCYAKNENWASCNATCQVGLRDDPTDTKKSAWRCIELGERSPPLPPKNKSVPCSKSTESCLKSQCCAQPDMQCYMKNDDYASCNSTCQVGLRDDPTDTSRSAWRCIELGERSPPPEPKTTTSRDEEVADYGYNNAEDEEEDEGWVVVDQDGNEIAWDEWLESQAGTDEEIF